MSRKLNGLFLFLIFLFMFSGCKSTEDDTVVLRIANCEEYIDEGDWDEEDNIILSDGSIITGENFIIDDFEKWYYETYGIKVRCEYSTYGTNEDLYNQIYIGDTFDLVCPSEYMITKMYREDMLYPYEESFFDEKQKYNYYAKGLSPYIKNVFEEMDMGGAPIGEYAAGYMWGTLGIVYDPKIIDSAEVQHWDVFLNPEYKKNITIKDSVRDAYFAGVNIFYQDEITDKDFLGSEDYHKKLGTILNSTDEKTVNGVEEILSKIVDNVFSLETDSGRADVATGKVAGSMQWSGDAVYTMEEAEEEGRLLYYSTPQEGTNLWFDGWVMLKSGIQEDNRKLHAAESFVNFISRPDNAIRNMSYIGGYSSCISATEDGRILDYINFLYGDENGDTYYPLDYFFTNEDSGEDSKYLVHTTKDFTKRQLYAHYAPKDVVDRSVVMEYFSDEGNERINRMWINVRCFDPLN